MFAKASLQLFTVLHFAPGIPIISHTPIFDHFYDF